MGATSATEHFYALFGGKEKLFINKVIFEAVYYCLLLLLFVIKESAQVQL